MWVVSKRWTRKQKGHTDVLIDIYSDPFPPPSQALPCDMTGLDQPHTGEAPLVPHGREGWNGRRGCLPQRQVVGGPVVACVSHPAVAIFVVLSLVAGGGCQKLQLLLLLVVVVAFVEGYGCWLQLLLGGSNYDVRACSCHYCWWQGQWWLLGVLYHHSPSLVSVQLVWLPSVLVSALLLLSLVLSEWVEGFPGEVGWWRKEREKGELANICIR